MVMFTDTQSVVDALEKKYESRDLRITEGPFGYIPVQAYGEIDGMRFYFRFRGNWGSLRVGPFDAELEEQYTKRLNEDRLARLEAAKTKGDDFMRALDEGPIPVVKSTDRGFLPHRVVKTSSVQGKDPEDVYKGDLTLEEQFDMFSELVDTLVDVKEGSQLNEHFRIWMEHGREAANEYLEQQKTVFRQVK